MKIAITAAILVAFAGLATPAAHAQEGEAQADDASRRPHHELLLERFDTNGDGVLDAQEIQYMLAKQERLGRRALRQFDINRDGCLDASERQALRAARQKRRAEMMQKYDRNRDGRLDPAERQALHQARLQERFDRMLARYDTNGDGKLSWSEVSAQSGPKGVRAKRIEERFRAADVNGDGVLTREEFLRGARR